MKRVPRGPELTPGKRRDVVAMHKVKKSFAAIGRELNIKADTARKIWNRYLLRGDTKSVSRPSRPKKLNNRDRWHLKRYVKKNWNNRHQPLWDISDIINHDIGANTLCKEIRAFGLNHR